MKKSGKKLILFGTGELAAVAHFYFTHDSPYEVAAFTVDREFITSSQFQDLPVVPFEDIHFRYPSADHDFFVAIGYTKMNSLRRQKCATAVSKGYHLARYVSSKATTWPGLEVGENSFILEDNTIQPFARIGKGVILWSGNHIGHHSKIGDFCFITSHVVVSGGVSIGENCFIGVNATLRDHVTVAPECVVGAATLILKDTQEKGVYLGNPAELSKVPSDRLRKI